MSSNIVQMGPLMQANKMYHLYVNDHIIDINYF